MHACGGTRVCVMCTPGEGTKHAGRSGAAYHAARPRARALALWCSGLTIRVPARAPVCDCSCFLGCDLRMLGRSQIPLGVAQYRACAGVYAGCQVCEQTPAYPANGHARSHARSHAHACACIFAFGCTSMQEQACVPIGTSRCTRARARARARVHCSRDAFARVCVRHVRRRAHAGGVSRGSARMHVREHGVQLRRHVHVHWHAHVHDDARAARAHMCLRTPKKWINR